MLRTKIEQAGTQLVDFDHQTGRFFTKHNSGVAAGALHIVSKLADQPQLRTLSAALVAAGIFARSDRLVRAGARMLVAHEVATFAKNQIKNQMDRVRPRAADSRQAAKLKKGKHSSKEMTSFPSGHSAGAMAVARAFSREFPEYGAAAVGGATLIASLQIPRCAHYPSDVAAGLALGLATEKAVDAAWNAAEMTERSES
jgi:membrane-associated phospholipid phosphatase